jgi:chromosome partitioning protein
MHIIAVIAQKGGTGKTTLALCLAVEAERHGKTTAVVDLDPQATASNWGDRRQTTNPVIVSAQPARLRQVLAAARANGADLVFIDTPARSEQSALEAAKASDIVLIPCRPAIYDLETLGTTVELIRYAGARPTAVVLNGVPSRGAKRAQAEEVVRGLAIPICPAAFGYRAAFNDSGALGLTAYEYEPGGKAALEIEQVYTFVSKLVKELPSEQGGSHVKESHRPASRHA